jgi:acetyl esterase/lipase
METAQTMRLGTSMDKYAPINDQKEEETKVANTTQIIPEGDPTRKPWWQRWEFAMHAPLFFSCKWMHQVFPKINSANISAEAKTINTLCSMSPENTRFVSVQRTIEYQRMMSNYTGRAMPEPAETTSVREEMIAGVRNYWVYSEAARAEKRNAVVVYIHGGSWMFGELAFYKRFLARWSERTSLPMLFVDYPLCPENGVTIKHQVKAIINVIKEVQVRFPSATEGTKNIIISGDSAGGHLSLLIGQKIVATEPELAAQIAGLGLISPLADLSLSSPTFESNKGLDAMVTKPTCVFDVSIGVGLQNIDTKNLALETIPKEIFEDPELNPLAAKASVKGLPPVRIVIGSHEVLLAECQQLDQLIREAGGDSELIIGEAMQHIYIVADGFAPETTRDAEAFEKSLNALLIA